MEYAQKKIGVGLIGYGLSGKLFHSTLLKAHGGYKIVKVLSSRAQEVTKDHPEATPVDTLDALLRDPSVDLIVNTAPNQFHFSYALSSLDAGKHVVVEKPFVNTSTEGERLIAKAKRQNRILTVFQNRRWDSDFLTVKKLIETDRLGEIYLFESYFDRLRPLANLEKWREKPGPGAGLFYDLGSHLLDQAFFLFGTPDDVVADIETQRSGGVTDDYFHVTLKYKKKRVILRSSSFTNQTPRFFIQGEKGNFIKYGLDPQEMSLKAGESPASQNFGLENESQYGTLLIGDGAPAAVTKTKIVSERGNYLDFYRQLFDCLTHENVAAPVDPLSSLAVIRLIESVISQ